jgi:hypothetical protein
MMGMILINIGVIIRREMMPNTDPINVSKTAVCPSPCFKNRCPDSVLIIVSSLGAEKYVDGMKSTNVWVIASEMTNMDAIMGSVVAMSGEVTNIVVIKFV